MRLLYKTGPMESLRKWFYKPKRDDRSLLAQFFFADDALNMVAAELDSFDGRKDPDRCSTLVNQLRHAQDRVLNITSQIMDQVLGDERVARGFRVKFPEDVLQDNLAGQLWFGAECLAAGSSIMNREEESAAMRPLAKALTRSLETVRSLLREQCLRPRGMALSQQDDMLHESLKIFDRLFSEFELCYVSAMVNVKTPHEFEAQQLICVLFSESLKRALKQNLLTQEQVDAYDPALMFAVPRLAIVNGLLIYASGPLSLDKSPEEMSDMFRPFRSLLHKIRCLLWTLERRELMILERLLCTNEDVANFTSDAPTTPADATTDSQYEYPDIGEFVSRFYADHAHCRDLYTQRSSSEPTITESDYLPDNIEVMTPILDGLRRLSQDTDMLDEPNDIEISRTQSIDTTSTDTFQTNDSKDFLDSRVRKISKSEEHRADLASLRNLSTNGLMMFDPLVINAITASTSSENRQMPDNDLVTSLNEQVTEIADRLSSIVNSDVDMIEHQIHSFSTNDVPTLISTEADDEFGYAGPRNDQLSCMPSTSHGYLIPNAISQEPVVLASLSHNNSAVFNQDDENSNEINGAMFNNDLPLIIPDNIDTEIVNTNISIANANLSSLLLTNEEYRHSFIGNNENINGDDMSFHSAKTTLDKNEDKVKFMLGYESDHESAVDSGVSTENTSLDRSPDTDQSNDMRSSYMQQNRVLKSPDISTETKESTLESSFSNMNGDVTVNLVYIEQDTQKNEAGSSSHIIDSNINDRFSNEDGLNEAATVNNENSLSIRNEESSKSDILGENRDIDKKLSKADDDNIRNVEASNSSQTSVRKKVRKSGTKSKKKRSKMWSPGIVLLDNRMHTNNSPLRLNLDHFVDESGTSCNTSECADDEQIALALQAQELAARQQARGKFKSSEDLIHRLFVCIAGVADQLQTNFAADLRNILKAVFIMNQTPDVTEIEEKPCKKDSLEYMVTEDQIMHNGSSIDSVYSAEEVYADSNSDSANSESSRLNQRNTVDSSTMIDQSNINRRSDQSTEQRRKSIENSGLQASVSTGDLSYREDRHTTRTDSTIERLPEWIPDIAAADCMRCCAHFTAFRRRHHCRNCGKVFCASCSSNSIPLPRYGQLKPVRVCDECFRSIADSCRRPQTSNLQQR